MKLFSQINQFFCGKLYRVPRTIFFIDTTREGSSKNDSIIRQKKQKSIVLSHLIGLYLPIYLVTQASISKVACQKIRIARHSTPATTLRFLVSNSGQYSRPFRRDVTFERTLYVLKQPLLAGNFCRIERVSSCSCLIPRWGSSMRITYMSSFTFYPAHYRTHGWLASLADDFSYSAAPISGLQNHGGCHYGALL